MAAGSVGRLERTALIRATSAPDVFIAARAPIKPRAAFTLVEVLVSVGVLALLVLFATQLLNNAASVTTLAGKQMDADSQTRALLDRMAIDFAQMVKRSDVDYYIKASSFATGSPTPAPTGVRTLLQPGNDVIAFYSTVPGYYPSSGSPSPVSLVAYRINAVRNKLERMGKGLLWNGSMPAAGTPPPVLFMPIPIASAVPTPELPSPPPTPIPTPAWPEIAGSANWSDAEDIGPQVFRFEYYYLLKGQSDPVDTATTYPAVFSDTPWDARICSCPPASASPVPTPTPPPICCHVAPTGLQDVAAIVIVIAVIDPRSKVLLSDTTTPPQIAQVASQLIDWGDPSCGAECTQTNWQTTPGLLRARWQKILDAITTLPRPAIAGIRIYERSFYLSPPTL